jgi:molybdate transport repressor ModE-like protein
MTPSPRHRPSFKLWLETDEGMVFGPGLYRLLRKISEVGTLKASAEGLGMSYRFAWGLIHEAEDKMGQPLVTSHKGGKSGGGGAELTEVGRQFLEEFSHVELILNDLLVNWELIERERPLTKFSAVVKGMEERDGGTVLTVAVESRDIELSIPRDRMGGLKVGDTVKFDVLSLSGSLEKAED